MINLFTFYFFYCKIDKDKEVKEKIMKYEPGTEVIWHDRKRFLGMPLSFTRYSLVKKEGAWVKLFSNIGLLFSVIDEINLYRICDITLHRSLLDKIVGTGTIIVKSSDESKPTLLLKNIKEPFKVRDLLSNLVEEQRKINNVNLAELHSHS